MDLAVTVKWLHIVGAAVLFGTGIGIAFFMVMAHRTHNPAIVAHVAGTVVVADFLFTATAVILQPVTGIWLAHTVGWQLTEGWILLSLTLYVFAGLFWMPVVWIQMRLRDLARAAAAAGEPLPAGYRRLYHIWFASGFPAFGAVLGIYWLMLVKPSIRLF
jgi:uncharacterized membrane protein